jgi:hypothetical protein
MEFPQSDQSILILMAASSFPRKKNSPFVKLIGNIFLSFEDAANGSEVGDGLI